MNFISGLDMRYCQGREVEHMTLDMIPRDVTARVASVDWTDAQGIRLMEMGMVPGARVRVVKSAPLGDPIQVCIRNYHLALRRSEAKSVTVVLE
jgi:ferrous iron transport protein A